MAEHWMVSYIVGLSPKILFKNGEFVFTEKEAKDFLLDVKAKYPDVEFHLSKNGVIQKENESLNLG